jgi:hypothetical protein
MANRSIAEAVFIAEGKIKTVGSLSDCQAQATSSPQMIDLGGKCMMPGFIDVHTHPMMLGMTNIWADLSWPGVSSIEQLIHTLKEEAKKLPANEPVCGFGFDWRRMKDGRMPDARDLDQVAADRPVHIMHASGHYNVINTFYLDMLGITADTKDPEGGVIGRYEDGSPNGQLQDSGCDLLTGPNGVKVRNHGPNLHMPDPIDRLLEYVLVGQKDYLKAGITTVVDVQVTKREARTYLAARDRDLLKMRVVMMYLSNLVDHMEALGMESTLGDLKVSAGPLKLYADGSLTAGSAYFNEPYAHDPNYYGYTYHQPDELKQLIIQAHRLGIQTATHAQGAAAIQIVIDAVREAQKQVPRDDIRHRIEHCGLPTKEQVMAIKELGIWPVSQPQHVYQYGEGVVKAVGEKGKDYSPYGWFLQCGVPIVLSSDAPVVRANPLEAVYAAMTRKTAAGNTLGEDLHCISVEDAFKGYTLTAAAATHREKHLGSLEPGKQADMVILDQDPFEVGVNELPGIQVKETWVAGEQVYKR